MTPLFKNLCADQLQEALGIPAKLARQIQASVIRQDALPTSLPGFSDVTLGRIRAAHSLPHLTLLDRRVSAQDGFAKYLFKGDGPDPFEAVRIPLLHRPGDEKYIVCVSSQAGCAMGCRFCQTARMGFQRNLHAWEIVDQVVKIQNDSPHPVRGIVFMGMGEPLLNYDAVIQAARIFSEPCGKAITAKSITISTVGIVPAIRRFTEEGHHFKLVVSLTAADPDLRRDWMPVEKAYPTETLVDALRAYHASTRRRVTLAWTMISGVNTREEDAIQLASIVKDLPIIIDLIDVNDPTGLLQPPDPGELKAFRDALRKHVGAPVVRRYSGGKDIHAACGMLALVGAVPTVANGEKNATVATEAESGL